MSGPVEARRRLLLSLLHYEEFRQKVEEKAQRDADAGVPDVVTGRPPTPGMMPDAVPLWENEWEGLDHKDVALAAKEATALGEIEYDPPFRHGAFTLGPFVRLTDKGMRTAAQMRGPKLVPATPETP